MATHAYLEARIALQRTSAADGTANLKTYAALAAQIRAECPGVMAGSPPHVKGEKLNQASMAMLDEVLSATFGAAEHLQHPADERFTRTVRRLHWSNPRLTKLLHSLALEQDEQAAIPAPDLCPDLKFWVASGYTAISPATKQLLHRHDVVSSITRIEPEPHESLLNAFNLDALVKHRLKPYEDHADQRLARRAFPHEVKLINPRAKPFLEAIGAIFEALGREPTPAAPVTTG